MYIAKNNAQLIGHALDGMEFSIDTKGKKWVRFLMAVETTCHTRGGLKVPERHYHEIVAWGTLAEQAHANVKKNTNLAIQGKLISEKIAEFQNRPFYKVHIEASEIHVLSPKRPALKLSTSIQG